MTLASKALVNQGEMRRRAILKFVRSYQERQGFSPTIQEVADAVGLVSPNATRNHLVKLADEGFMRLTPRISRGIALVSPAPDGWSRKA